MPMSQISVWRRGLLTAGSLRFGAVILVLLLVAMACATVYESMHGSAQALSAFYLSPWFTALLALLGVNILAAVLVRFPLSRWHIGFVTTHSAILIILIGALTTKWFGIDGQLPLREGEKASEFVTSEPAVRLLDRESGVSSSIDLNRAAFHSWLRVLFGQASELRSGDVRVTLERYLPDSRIVQQVTNDGKEPFAAIEVSLGAGDQHMPLWLFDNRPAKMGGLTLSFRSISDTTELARMAEAPPVAQPSSNGTLELSLAGKTVQIPLEECTDQAVAVGDSPYTVKLLRYLPHAIVGADKRLTNASERPVNPAVEVEIAGPEGTETRLAFANFPDFASAHGSATTKGLKLTFVHGAGQSEANGIEILGGPQGELYARVPAPEGGFQTRKVELGTVLELPAQGLGLVVSRRFDRARAVRIAEPVEHPHEEPNPAVLVKVNHRDSEHEVWLQKFRAERFVVDGRPYELLYANQIIPLGFTVGLQRFTVGTYPGTQRPRSFTSEVTISDASGKQSDQRVVSMNNPTSHGGYTFFQASYNLEGGAPMSILSVSQDPGLPIVFTGYIVLMIGMVTVLATRVRQRQIRARAMAASKHRGRTSAALAAWIALPIAALMLIGAPTQAAKLPASLDLTAIQELPVQHDGRWPPLDTVARDLVETVTGDPVYKGHDPVAVLLGWFFEPEAWAQEPLIRIPNAELRGELLLPPDKTEFSFSELLGHRRLRSLVDSLTRVERGQKLDPLQKKVSDINEKLMTLQAVFGATAIRAIPHAEDPLGAWTALGPPRAGDPSGVLKAKETLEPLRAAFLADNAAGFNVAAVDLAQALSSLPAAYRPNASLLRTEIRYNALQPFRTSWQIMVVGSLLALAAMGIKRKWFDAVVVVVMLAGFLAVTYGLSLRWQIAGRIPAANMFESLLFLGWGVGAFAIIAVFVFRQRLVPLTASIMSAVSLSLADCLPIDHYIRPIAPVLMDTVWMSIHVPVIMVSYSVLALAVLIAHGVIIVAAFAPRREELIARLDDLHYWYVHAGSILLTIGVITGSMWAASSWGRYWGWDPKEVWSLVALVGYLTILHVRIDPIPAPRWVLQIGVILAIALFAIVIPALSPMSVGKLIGLGGTGFAMTLFVLGSDRFATAVKSIVCFWLIIMTYVGVNYVLGIGLHSYGFGTGAVVRYLFLTGGIDLVLVALCYLLYAGRKKV